MLQLNIWHDISESLARELAQQQVATQEILFCLLVGRHAESAFGSAVDAVNVWRIDYYIGLISRQRRRSGSLHRHQTVFGGFG